MLKIFRAVRVLRSCSKRFRRNVAMKMRALKLDAFNGGINGGLVDKKILFGSACRRVFNVETQ